MSERVCPKCLTSHACACPKPSAPTDRDECGIPHMLSKPPKDAGAKYGWQICDEVQRFVSNSSEMQFVPIAAYEKLERELAEAKADLKILCDNKSDIDLMNHKLRKQSAALVEALELVEPWLTRLSGCIGMMSDANLREHVRLAIAKFKEGK